jgi:hypothetical protein
MVGQLERGIGIIQVCAYVAVFVNMAKSVELNATEENIRKKKNRSYDSTCLA